MNPDNKQFSFPGVRLKNQFPISPNIYLYATAALLGACVYIACHHFWPDQQRYNLVIGTAATLLLRLAGIRWKLTLPVFQ